MTAFTDRNVPAPWEEYDMCGKAAGLPTTAAPHLALCAPCATRQTLIDAAQDSLEVLITPFAALGAA